MKAVARSLACTGLIVFGCLSGTAIGQEVPIEVPTPDGPSYRECRVDMDSAYARQTTAIRKKIEALDAGVADIKKLRSELLDNRIFLGAGPEASSDEAMEIAQILLNTKTICDITTTMYEALNPGKGALGTYVPGKLTADNIYNFLKAGQSIEAIGSANSAKELLWAVGTNLVEWNPLVNLATGLGENLKAGYDNHQAWKGYRDELKVALAKLGRELELTQARIKAEERRIYGEMREGFDKFCAEESSPRALDDRFSARSGETVVFPVTSNDRDPDGGRVRAITADAAHSDNPLRGRVSIDSSAQFSGNLRYVAPEDFAGVETIRYTILDDEGVSATALVTVQVTPKQVPGGVTSSVTTSAAPPSPGGASGSAGDVDLDAIEARCKNSRDITRCIDENLSGASTATQTGRQHAGCEQARDSIHADERELQELTAEASAPGSTPQQSMRRQLAREQMDKVRARIDATRADARNRWGCQ